MTACGIPVAYNASKEWADKKVVLFSVPGEYLHFLARRILMTPANCIPPV